MSIKLILLAGLVTVALVLGDVVAIQVKPENLSKAPARLISVVTNDELRGKAAIQFTKLKRSVEQRIADTDERRLELALSYVEEDTAKLEAAAESTATGVDVIERARLLADSTQLVSELLDKVSIDVIAQSRDTARETVVQTQQALETIAQVKETYSNVTSTANDVIAAITDNISPFVTMTGSPVAGVRDREEEASNSPSPTPIPLSF